jgi:hypothetical protein
MIAMMGSSLQVDLLVSPVSDHGMDYSAAKSRNQNRTTEAQRTQRKLRKNLVRKTRNSGLVAQGPAAEKMNSLKKTGDPGSGAIRQRRQRACRTLMDSLTAFSMGREGTVLERVDRAMLLTGHWKADKKTSRPLHAMWSQSVR